MPTVLVNAAVGGAPRVKATDMAVWSDPDLVSWIDYNEAATWTALDGAGRVVAALDRKSGQTLTPALTAAPAHLPVAMGAAGDGQTGLTLASNRGVMVSAADLWPTGSWTAMSLFRQDTGGDGYPICSNDVAGVALGYLSSNALRLYTRYSTLSSSPTASVNDGEVSSLIVSYDAAAQTLRAWLNNVLKGEFTGVAAPTHADRRLSVGGINAGASRVGVVDGAINSTLLFKAAGADGSALLGKLKRYGAGRFPSRGWVTP